jgi:hypothetical protein
MAESMLPTRVQLQKMHRALNEKVLDKACSDPRWKQQLIEDPELAMREAGFPELQQLRQATLAEIADVQGQGWSGGWGGGNFGGWGGGGNFGGWGGGGNFGGWGGGGNFGNWWGWWW